MAIRFGRGLLLQHSATPADQEIAVSWDIVPMGHLDQSTHDRVLESFETIPVARSIPCLGDFAAKGSRKSVTCDSTMTTQCSRPHDRNGAGSFSPAEWCLRGNEMAIKAHLAVLSALRIAEADGQRCAGPIVLTGLVLGAGVVALVSGPLGQTSRFSLELLLLLLFQLLGPLLVSVITLALLLSSWLQRQQDNATRGMASNLVAAALVGPSLMLLLLTTAVLGGILLSPRADLAGELSDLLAGIQLRDLVRTVVRATLFVVGSCWYSLWRSKQAGFRSQDSSFQLRWSSDLLLEGLALLLALKLIWIVVLDPIRLSMQP